MNAYVFVYIYSHLYMFVTFDWWRWVHIKFCVHTVAIACEVVQVRVR